MPFRWVVSSTVGLATAFIVCATTAAYAQSQPGLDCRPPAYVQRAIRGAQRVVLVRLGPPMDCVVDPSKTVDDPACFAGYRRAELFRLPRDGARSVSRMFSVRNLACGATGGGAGPVYVVGFDVAGGGGTVRVTLRLPRGAVEFEIANGRRFSGALSPSGLREWQRLLTAFASQVGRVPDEFERDLARDAQPAPVVPARDSSAPRADPLPSQPVAPEMAAEPVVKVAPSYPDNAREAGVDGTVMVSALVGTDGRVRDARIVKSIPMLDAAAVAAVMQWSFQPAKRGGTAVDSWFLVPVKFTLH